MNKCKTGFVLKILASYTEKVVKNNNSNIISRLINIIIILFDIAYLVLYVVLLMFAIEALEIYLLQ